MSSTAPDYIPDDTSPDYIPDDTPEYIPGDDQTEEQRKRFDRLNALARPLPGLELTQFEKLAQWGFAPTPEQRATLAKVPTPFGPNLEDMRSLAERGLGDLATSSAGLANPTGAFHLAMRTSMSRGDAIATLAAIQAGAGPAVRPAAKSDALRDRMAATQDPKVDASGDAQAGR